jgi:hypothetical protein
VGSSAGLDAFDGGEFGFEGGEIGWEVGVWAENVPDLGDGFGFFEVLEPMDKGSADAVEFDPIFLDGVLKVQSKDAVHEPGFFPAAVLFDVNDGV